jgi:hypothetical protein
MDVCCDLLVSELIQDPELVPVGSRADEFRYGPHIRLALRPMPAHIAGRLPETLRGLKSYVVTGDGIDLMEYEVNSRAPELRGPSLDTFLFKQLANRRPWAFVFEWHCDQIDDVFSVDDVVALTKRLRANLAWNVERQGFIAYRT